MTEIIFTHADRHFICVNCWPGREDRILAAEYDARRNNVAADEHCCLCGSKTTPLWARTHDPANPTHLKVLSSRGDYIGLCAYNNHEGNAVSVLPHDEGVLRGW